jgi:hypothetical protein
MAKNRTHVGTAAGIVEVFKQASEGVQVPKHIKLRAADKPYWESITRSRKDWNDHDLIQAAALARTYTDIAKLQRELDKEGVTVVNAQGSERPNPKFIVIDTLVKRTIAMARAIQVHAMATQGESKVQRKRNMAKQDALRTLEQRQVDEAAEDLLARPSH